MEENEKDPKIKKKLAKKQAKMIRERKRSRETEKKIVKTGDEKAAYDISFPFILYMKVDFCDMRFDLDGRSVKTH